MKTSFTSSLDAMWTTFWVVYIVFLVEYIERFYTDVWATTWLHWIAPELFFIGFIAFLFVAKVYFAKFWLTYFKDYLCISQK